jgi:murein DD-endopeptidase MepM/ murein hydrolase activator NlpD
MSRIDDRSTARLHQLLVRELLKGANVFPELQGAGGGFARDTFIDVIAECIARAEAGPGNGGHTEGPVATQTARSFVDAVIEGPGRVSSPFGERVDPFTGAHRHHRGVDVAAPEGTPITSLEGGEVVFAGERGGYGLTVEVRGVDGHVTRYAHARALHVSVGDRVASGDVIAEVGSTGRSTGPHVHVEVLKRGVAVDPTTALLAGGADRATTPRPIPRHGYRNGHPHD